MALLSPVPTVSHTAAQVVAAYGAVDLPMNAWPALLQSLFTNISSPEVPDLAKVSALETLGYMCDAMKVKIEPVMVNQILSSIIEGMRADRKDEIRLAAVVALNNSLGFTDTNFDNEAERNHIMQAICEATQSTNYKIREKAYECCATVAEFYYEKLKPYAPTLYNLTVNAIRTDEPVVGMQALEFWTTVADTEVGITEEIHEGTRSPESLLGIMTQAAPTLMPLILECMTKQDEDADDDDNWDISKSAATLLEAVARVLNDQVVDLVLPFITQNVQNPDWHFREASILAFGMILDGPSDAKILPLIHQALPVFIGSLRDPKALIRDSAAWTLGKICEIHRSALRPDMLQAMVEALSVALGDSAANVVSQVCFAFFSLAESCENESDAPSNMLSHIMPSLIPKLLEVSTRTDLESENIRADAYEAVNKMVEYSAVDMHPFLLQLLAESLNRLEQTANPAMPAQQRTNLQSSLSSLVSEIIPKLSYEEFSPCADRTMQILLQVFTNRGAVAHEDAFLAIGKVCDNLRGDFIKYMPYLQVHLVNALKTYDEFQLCIVAVGIIGDACRALGKSIMPFCDDLMRCLLELLQSPVLHRSVKPHVFSHFADIALAIEGDFERYCGVILDMLKQAGEVNIDSDVDEDLIDYINSLRNAILEAYIGILQGLTEAKKQDLVFPALATIVDFLQRSGTDENRSDEVLKSAVGILGDLGMTYGARVQPIYRMPFVAQILKDALEADDDTKQIAQWAQEVRLPRPIFQSHF